MRGPEAPSAEPWPERWHADRPPRQTTGSAAERRKTFVDFMSWSFRFFGKGALAARGSGIIAIILGIRGGQDGGAVAVNFIHILVDHQGSF